MTLSRAEKGMCGVALALLTICLASARTSCSSNTAGSISIPANNSKMDILQPGLSHAPVLTTKIKRSRKLNRPSRISTTKGRTPK